MAMMAITTSNSIKVKALRHEHGVGCAIQDVPNQQAGSVMEHSVGWKAGVHAIGAGNPGAPDPRTQIHNIIGAGMDATAAVGGEQVPLVVARAEESLHRGSRRGCRCGIQSEAGRWKGSDKQRLLQVDGLSQVLLLDEGQQLGVDGKPE